MITVPAFNFALEYRNDVMITVSAKVWRIQVESCTMFMNEAPSSFEQDGPTSPHPALKLHGSSEVGLVHRLGWREDIDYSRSQRESHSARS